MSISWLARVQVPADVTGTIPIIILLCSRVNTNNTVLCVYLNCANFSCSSASVWFLSGDGMLSADVNGNEMWVNWRGWEASKQPVLLLIKGEILQVAAWLSGVSWPEAKDPQQGWMILSGWGLVSCVDFISGSVWVMLLLMYCKKKKEWGGRGGCRGLGFRYGDISPVWTFISITWSAWQWHKWRSQSLLIITLTSSIKNTSQLDWMFDGVVLWLIYKPGSCR